MLKMPEIVMFDFKYQISQTPHKRSASLPRLLTKINLRAKFSFQLTHVDQTMASLATAPSPTEKRLNARNAKKVAQKAAEMNTSGESKTTVLVNLKTLLLHLIQQHHHRPALLLRHTVQKTY